MEPPPIWIMRQAGRYLPEYRETRSRAGSFLDLCLTPELAAEVTLQPVRRFDFDAAILFSDILIVPHALGQKVEFHDRTGPALAPLADIAALDLEAFDERAAPTYETVRLARDALAGDKALIGFCGAPWTVATYMVGGRGTAGQDAARLMALQRPDRFQALIDVLVEASVRYLIGQVRAGADVLKIFDSWAGVLDEAEFDRWAVRPVRAVVEGVRAESPHARVIAFPRGAGVRLKDYAERTSVNGVAVDLMTPLRAVRTLVPEPIALQGNLDPLRLRVGGRALDEGIDGILSAMRGRAHIFNLGHGIMPDTPLENVTRLVDRVRTAT